VMFPIRELGIVKVHGVMEPVSVPKVSVQSIVFS